MGDTFAHRTEGAGSVRAVTNRVVAPAGIAPPAARYAHAVVSDAPGRMLHTAGVVPTAADGSVPNGVAAQARTVWATIGAVLDDVGFVPTDIVSVTTYVVDDHTDELAAVMAERDAFLDGHLAASTLVVVPRLAQPAWKVEIAVVAVQGR
jgi:2-iminobutanoate/2-iminopropanoate deaminase